MLVSTVGRVNRQSPSARRAHCRFLASTILVVVPGVALAQAEPAAAPTGTSATPSLPNTTTAPPTAAPNGVADIVVTATRSSESLSKVAASVTAISGDAIGAGGIKDIGSLSSAVPNLSVGDQFGVNRTFIRGIGLTSIDLGADGAVAFLQDGAIIARPAAQLAGFYDIDRVEVLRGPQGTLYGRGATAGAINLITKRPTEELSGYANASYGNYNAVTLEGGVGGPIVGDKIMVRVSGKYDRRDGYGKNLFTGNDVDNRNAYAIRASVLVKPFEDFEILVSGEHFHEHDNDYAFHYFGPTIAPDNPLGAVFGGNTLISYSAKQGVAPNFRKIYSDQDALNRRNGNSVTATIDWRPDNWDVKSITSYHDFSRFNRDDLDVTNVQAFGQNNYTEKSKTVSQEFLGTYKTARFDALFGATYFHEQLFGEVRVPLTNLGVLLGLPANALNDQFYLQSGTVDIDAYGIYGQGSYLVTDELKITAGARYSYEKRTGVGSFQFLNFVPTDKSKGWGAVTPTVQASYQLTDQTLLYASVTRGFKSGVINVGSENAVINPEYAWGYEAGVKSSAFDNRLAGSLAAFYIDYSNLQVGFVGADSVVTTVNAASARNYGLELELRARPTQGLSLELFATYLDARYTNFTTGDYRQGFALVNLKGNRLSNAPEFTVRGGANYDIPLGDAGKINIRGDVNWQDRVYFTEFNNADATQAPYATVNAGVRYTTASGRWSLDLWGRNLTDHFIITNNIVSAPLYSSVRVGSLAPPRTYGVTASVNF
ncbi:TonB-dependent receptor (plasmid) [Polymorphobacter sp. PAMC 29334]|uniref:TonB-dependent receptor n=1 Tax=Polymorphobacter sp. PAMC 29334 TaxID=2862331 RepID=UPI001C681EFD|nr:TonB-dependent receptor [Polymorphobacter sp. PAMC 29334]QYE33047.1 TonB-dependent receptor [Polymorphobacter sp. PAMC 29334]